MEVIFIQEATENFFKRIKVISQWGVQAIAKLSPNPSSIGGWGGYIFIYTLPPDHPEKFFFATMKHNLEKQSCETKWADPKTVNRPNLNPKNILLEFKKARSSLKMGRNWNLTLEQSLQINVAYLYLKENNLTQSQILRPHTHQKILPLR